MVGLINTNNMKAKFLKIAGVKSEKEFYKKYPTEAAFFKAHPEAKKEIKKAQVGSYIGGGEQTTEGGFTPINFGDIQNQAQYFVTGEDPKAINYSDLLSTEDNSTDVSSLVQNAVDVFEKMKSSDSNEKSRKGKKVRKAEGGFSSFLGNMGGAEGIASAATDIISGIQQIKEQKKMVKQAEQASKVSDVAAQAAATRPEMQARKYVRPEDMLTNPNERFMSYGTGTNILAAEEGAQIGGNLTEIQNMYNPGTLYSDLGYEPLEDSDKVKNYRKGGKTPIAQTGFDWSSFAQKGGTNIAGQLANVIPGVGQDAGSSIGSGIGSAVGSAFGPVGSMVGKFAGKVIGGLIDRSDEKIKKFQEKTQKNIGNIALQQGAQAIQGQFSGFVRNGGSVPTAEDGWISHNWQPQVITKFGDYDVEDLLKPDPTMDTLRTGGNIRQNYMGPQDQMAFGGEVKTHWGGYAEPISYNPYLPGTGETVMFRGQSHDESDGKGRTGIGVSYGDTGNDDYTDYAEYGSKSAENKVDVEVERNEPAIETQDVNGEKSMLVYGNLKIPKEFASEIGDPNIDHKNLPKFKNYVAKLSKKEERANNTIAKAVETVNDIKPISSFDKLALTTQQTIIDANNQKLKQIAVYKQNAAALQQAINDSAEELGLDADALAKGKTIAAKVDETAKNGRKIEKAQTGFTSGMSGVGRPTGYSSAPKPAKKSSSSNSKKTPSKSSSSPTTTSDSTTKFVPPTIPLVLQSAGNKKPSLLPQIPSKEEPLVIIPYSPDYTKKQIEKIANEAKQLKKRSEIEGGFKAGRPTQYTPPKGATTSTDEDVKDEESVLDYLKALSSQLAPILNKPYEEDLDPSQILGELTALATNQLQPVQAQTYQPLLAVAPGSVSLQDQLNANQADFNALQRKLGYNPEGLAQLAAQKYAANSNVLANQFKLNQELQNQVFNKNRDMLNDAQLKNLAILDQQYTRQEQAKSNTKATFQEAMSSIASKTLQNKLSNRTLAAYSNMFPMFGFGPGMRATPRGLTFFNTDMASTSSEKDKEKAEKAISKLGGKTKKSFMNSSIVKMYKG